MSKTINSALAQHLAGEVTTLATCWKITRRDGVVLGFTDHVRDLEVEPRAARPIPRYMLMRFDTDHMAVTIETYRLHAWQQIPIVELRT